MFATHPPTPNQPRTNRVAPRWFALPVVRETPLPKTPAGSAW